MEKQLDQGQARALLQAFSCHVESGVHVSPASSDALEALIGTLWQRARAAWPGLSVDGASFGRALGARFASRAPESSPDPAAWLSELHVEDLYLAVACETGDARALSLLDQLLLRPLARELKRTSGLAAYGDEAEQMLRVRLFVSRDEAAPRIAGYRGSGPLKAWLRLTLTRLTLDLHKRSARETTLDDHLLEDASPVMDPEMDLLRRDHADDVALAVREAFVELTNEDKAILRMHFLDGLSAHEIGPMFQVSGRTIQRRIAETRRQILETVRRRLALRLGVAPSQLDTLMRLVRSDLNLSIRGVLVPVDSS